MSEAAEFGNHARMPAVINHADQQEERSGGQAMIQHLKRRALQPLGGEGKNPQNHQSHVADRGIGDKLFQIRLHHGHQGAINDADDREDRNDRAPC